MREEEAAAGVMRVCTGLAVEMVRAMVPRPVVDRPLVGYTVAQQGYRAEGKARFVAAVRPEPVSTASDAEATNRPQRDGPQERGDLAPRNHKEARQSEKVAHRDVNCHGPPNVVFRPWR